MPQNGMGTDNHVYTDPDGDCDVIVQIRPARLGQDIAGDSDVFHPSKFQDGDFIFAWVKSLEPGLRYDNIYFSQGQLNRFVSLMSAIARKELDKLTQPRGEFRPYTKPTEDEIYALYKNYTRENAGQAPAIAFLSKRFLTEQFVFFGVAVTTGRLRSAIDEGCGVVIAGFVRSKAIFFGSIFMGNWIFVIVKPRKDSLEAGRSYAFHMMSYPNPAGPPMTALQYTESCGKPAFANIIKIGSLTEAPEDGRATPLELLESAQGLNIGVDARQMFSASASLNTFGVTLPHKIMGPPIRV